MRVYCITVVLINNFRFVCTMCEPEYYLGVDVGTGSVRAGLVSSAGRVLAIHMEDIMTRNPRQHLAHLLRGGGG